jgi:hypothetical protein
MMNQPVAKRIIACCDEGFVASKGWDPVTGLGSVNHAVLVNMLTKPPFIEGGNLHSNTKKDAAAVVYDMDEAKRLYERFFPPTSKRDSDDDTSPVALSNVFTSVSTMFVELFRADNKPDSSSVTMIGDRMYLINDCQRMLIVGITVITCCVLALLVSILLNPCNCWKITLDENNEEEIEIDLNCLLPRTSSFISFGSTPGKNVEGVVVTTTKTMEV